MKTRFRKRRKLKKEVVIFSKIFLILILVLLVQNSKLIKNFINYNASKYIKKKYIKNNENLSMAFYSEKKEKNDDLFLTKESKDEELLIYIYNTHQTEKYLQANSLYNPTVMHASLYLSGLLNDNNLPSVVENRSITDVLNANGWAYGKSYKVSRLYLEDTYKKNNSIKYFFDIHRDAGSHDYTTICSVDKCYAKILFIVGLENPSYIQNEQFAENLSKRLNDKVDGLSKGILQKQGKKVNGVYNEDFSPRLILIEIGGENNTIDEVYNTVNVLSEVLTEYIKEEINYGR